MLIQEIALRVREIVQWIFLIPVLCGSVYVVLCSIAVIRLRIRPPDRDAPSRLRSWPPVTILKPVHGREKELQKNLRSACLQDYPQYQVVFSVQRPDDAALPLLKEIQKEFGPDLVTVAVENCRAGTNGKINNLIGGLKHARHDFLVISDSDVYLERDYLKTIIAPLSDPDVGCSCTLYKAVKANAWFEKMELLTFNADFVPNVIFALVSGASKFCLGASAAIHRSTLDRIGGLEALADYLVEDYEMGRRIWKMGKKVAIIPYFVDTIIDLKSPSHWWNHQVYWDQNTRAARPLAFFATAVIRSVPFALIYAAMRLGDPIGVGIFAAACFIRLTSASVILGWGLRDREGLRSLWLLPFRDIAALGTWLLALLKKTTVWRGASFIITRDGRLVAENAISGKEISK